MRRELLFQRALFFVLVVCLGVSLPVVGQRITGDITGKHHRQHRSGRAEGHGDGDNTGTNLTRKRRNQRDGNYRIPELSIGMYRVTASAQGFKTAVQTVEIQAGAVQANFKLTIGQRRRPWKWKAQRLWWNCLPTRTTMWTRKRSKTCR